MARATTGRGAIGFIQGEAGIGKTRLLSEARRLADERGFRVFAAAAAELERNRPFGPLIDAFAVSRGSSDEARRRLGRLIAGEGPDGHTLLLGSGTGAQYEALGAFVDLVEAEAAAGPTLIVLEDLHWCEASTLLVIRSLAKRSASLSLALLASYRPSPRMPEFERLVGELVGEGAEQIVLDPLQPDSVRCLVEHLVSATPGNVLLDGAARAGGNPLYVIELVNGLQSQGAIHRDGSTAEAEQVSIPTTIATTILGRLNLVAPETAEILRFAAVLGSTFTLTEVSLASGRTAASLLAPFAEAMAAGVVGEAGPRLSFRHDLVREAIYEAMPIAVRTALHREVGHALAAAGAPALQVAEHLALGAAPGDTQAVSWMWRAGREAMVTAPAAGARLLERALDLAGPGHRDETEMLADLLFARVWGGRAADAVEPAQTILTKGGDDSTLERVRLALVRALWMLARWEEALEIALARCRAPDVGADERARLLAETTFGQLYHHGPAAAIEQATEALELGRSLGDDLTSTLALQGIATSLFFEARFAEAVDVALEAVRIADASHTDEARRTHPHFILGQVYIGVDRLDDAEHTHRIGRQIGERIGSMWDSGWYVTGLASRRFNAGEWDDAYAELEAALALEDEIRTDLGKVWVASMLAVLLLHRDELPAAEQALETATAAMRASGPVVGFDWIPWVDGLIREARGDTAGAFDLLSRARDRFASLGMTATIVRFAADFVRVALSVGETGAARDMAATCERVAEKNQVPSWTGLALRCRGLVENDADMLVRAAETYGLSPRKMERALTFEDAANALATAGRTQEAVRLYEEALEIFGEAPAARDAARATAALRRLGIKRGARGPRKRPGTGWASLTATELDVVRLVAEGLSNPAIGSRLFISRHTVETHLRHVFAKLGVGSRAEVAAAAARQLAKS